MTKSIKPSDALKKHREEILRIIEKHDVINPRIFGSTARGDDTVDSDLDILVDPIPEKTTYISLISIKMEISELIGVNVDVFTPDTLKDDVYKTALQETIDI